jgi:hypothetical protein
LGGRMPILINPFLFLIAFGPIAVLFASVLGLACSIERLGGLEVDDGHCRRSCG